MKTEVIFAALLIAATPASATLIETSTPFGADTGVHETDQNLVFVDFARTRELTYDGLLAALSPGAMLDGYRLATTPQLDGLFDNAGLIDPFSGGPTGSGAVAVFNAFTDLIDSGALDDFGTGAALAHRAITSEIRVDTAATATTPASLSTSPPFASLERGRDDFPDSRLELSQITRGDSELSFFSDDTLSSLGSDFDVPQVKVSGFALVTDAPTTDVPAPGTWLLFLLAVLGIAVRRGHLGRTQVSDS